MSIETSLLRSRRSRSLGLPPSHFPPFLFPPPPPPWCPSAEPPEPELALAHLLTVHTEVLLVVLEAAGLHGLTLHHLHHLIAALLSDLLAGD